MWKIRILALVILFLATGLGFFVYLSETRPESNFRFSFGLDLSGGSHLVYRADTSTLNPRDVEDSMEALRDVIERRVNLFGVSEPLVQVEHGSILGSQRDRLIVELPGVSDVGEAVARIGETPLLEFKLLKNDIVFPEEAEVTAEELASFFEPTGLTGRLLKRAELQFGNGSHSGLSNEPIVLITFTDEGAKLFASITKENVGRVLAIFLDGVPLSNPVIQQEIIGGTAQISGGFTPEEARDLVRELNFGALPVPIELISTQTVGASLGSQAVESGVYAGMVGLLLVTLFLVVWYRLPGFVAVLSLGVYIIIMLTFFKLIPVTLTAAGIAGFILSIGMAVDANILIFERIRDELKRGATVSDAVEAGFKRAWLPIRDSNISSIITAGILFWFGTSLVEGFALTFGLGVLISMFTAITITKVFMRSVVWSDSGTMRFFFGSRFGTVKK